jgi:hypothetical protein
MAVVIARQKMVIEHAEGKHTVFPSPHPQSLPDHLLDHDYVLGAIASKWILPQKVEADPETDEAPADESVATTPRRRRRT